MRERDVEREKVGSLERVLYVIAIAALLVSLGVFAHGGFYGKGVFAVDTRTLPGYPVAAIIYFETSLEDRVLVKFLWDEQKQEFSGGEPVYLKKDQQPVLMLVDKEE